MLRIIIDGQDLDLPDGFSIDVDEYSPVFNDEGTQTLPVTVPATPRNRRLLRHAHRLDVVDDPRRDLTCSFVDGHRVRRGVVNVTSASTTAGISFNIGFDNSTAYNAWRGKMLGELSTLPVFDPVPEHGSVDSYMLWLYRGANSQSDPLAVFPYVVARNDHPDNSWKKIYETVNLPSRRSYNNPTLIQPTTVERLIDNKVTDVTVPEHYGLSPQLRVWALLQYVFEDLGLHIESNPFKENLELSRLVVMNNTVDACVLSTIKYSDLVPDVTVETFLHSLWVRFGLTYTIDNETGYVRLRLMRDLLNDFRGGSLPDELLEAEPLISYDLPHEVVLSAATSIEGAEPPTERWEEFAGDLSADRIDSGDDVATWGPERIEDPNLEWPTYEEDPDPDDNDWPDTGDARDDWDDWNNRNDGWDDDRDDGPGDRDDQDDRAMRAANGNDTRAAKAAGSIAEDYQRRPVLAYNAVSGQWYKLDRPNGSTLQSGSSYFNWDRKTTGHEALELKSEDEWVPVDQIQVPYSDDSAGGDFADYVPMFLVGARHRHTFIKGSTEEEPQTPLAFMFALRHTNELPTGTIGRVIPETTKGEYLTIDGTPHRLSLLFQFRNGLFATFWQRYDEILRHAGHTVEASARIPRTRLQSLDMLRPVLLRGILCLPDTITYTLPAPKELPAEITLRTLMPQGEYNLIAEQGIPDFAPCSRRLEWYLYREDSDAVYRASTDWALDHWRRQNQDYQPGVPGESRLEALPHELRLLDPTWKTDPSVPPTPPRYGVRRRINYKAEGVYYICEMVPSEEDPGDWRVEEFLGEIRLELDYTVELRTKIEHGEKH